MRLTPAATRLSIAALALTIVASVAQAAAPTIIQRVIAGGGRRSSTGAYTVTGTVGQALAGPTVGPMIGGTYRVRSGFWEGDGPIQCLADYDLNGVIDILDVLDFIDDFSVCELSPAPCGSHGDADINGDGFVDIIDFLTFIEAHSNGC